VIVKCGRAVIKCEYKLENIFRSDHDNQNEQLMCPVVFDSAVSILVVLFAWRVGVTWRVQLSTCARLGFEPSLLSWCDKIQRLLAVPRAHHYF
jgi:hypothetical protein